MVVRVQRAVWLVLSALLAARLFVGPFREGWSRMHTDFPNHYVAAILALRHEPLRQFYDWEWFQRQIQYAGIDRQLGGYTPYPPLTMIPLLPLAKLPPQRAKHVWLVLQLLFLAASIGLLSRLSQVGLLETLLLALVAYVSLATNFALGQYYVFLAFLLSAAVFCLLRGREWTGGALLGLIFSLKLYAAPFLLFFAVRRQWRALSGMAVSAAALGLAAVAWFGWHDVWFYVTSVMSRGIDGSIVDPYDPGLGSMAVLLRRLFVPEPELNPHPPVNAPALFFFLQTFYSLGLLAVALLFLPGRSKDDAPAVAYFIVVLFALSPVTASSHFILLLVPVVVLLGGATPARKMGLTALYILVQLPVRPPAAWLFPKLWFSLALAAYAGWPFRSNIRRRPAIAALAIVAAVSALASWRRSASYRSEPPQTAELVAPRLGALLSSAPAIGPGGPVYESMEDEFFGLRTGAQKLIFDGEAFHPAVPRRGSPIYFELVSHGHSQIVSTTGDVLVGHEMEPSEPAVSPDGARLAFISHGSLFVSGRMLIQEEVSDPAFFPDGQRIAFAQGFPGRRSIRAVAASGGVSETLVEGGDNFEPAVSASGELLAYVHQELGARQVWIRNLASGVSSRLTSGACNNDWPAWDSRAVVFASDCSRGYGLTALYRLPAR